MIISFIIKKWKLVLDMALVVVAVLLFSFWDPFGIFSTKLKLQDTANMVSKINDIGELVTIEYYGEVIASLHETELDIRVSDSIDQQNYDDFVLLKYDLFDIFQENNSRKELKRYIQTSIEKRIREQEDQQYQSFILYLREELLGRNNKKKEKRIERYVKEVIQFLFNEIKKNYKRLEENEFYSYLNENFHSSRSFSDYSKDIVKKELKENLTMIGRGWVKAGFRFNNLNESNFIYDPARSVVHLFNIQPEILNTDINPWFIPENKIEGFHIISASRNVNFKDAKKVKLKCVRKLEEKAILAGVLNRANDYGVESLKTFFSLLTGEKVNDVVLHADNYINLYNNIAKDSVVSYTEIEFLLETINRKKSELDTIKNEKVLNIENEKLKAFISKLRNVKYISDSSQFNFNYFFAISNSFLVTNTIKANNINEIDNYFNKYHFKIFDTINDKIEYDPPIEYQNLSYWFEDSISFIADYNHFLNYLNIQKPTISILTYDTLDNEKYSVLSKQKNIDLVDMFVLEDGYIVQYFKNINKDDDAYINYLKYQYAFDYFPDLINKYKQDSVSVNEIIKRIKKPKRPNQKWYEEEIKVISKLLEYEKHLNKTENFVDRLRKWSEKKRVKN